MLIPFDQRHYRQRTEMGKAQQDPSYRVADRNCPRVEAWTSEKSNLSQFDVSLFTSPTGLCVPKARQFVTCDPRLVRIRSIPSFPSCSVS